MSCCCCCCYCHVAVCVCCSSVAAPTAAAICIAIDAIAVAAQNFNTTRALTSGKFFLLALFFVFGEYFSGFLLVCLTLLHIFAPNLRLTTGHTPDRAQAAASLLSPISLSSWSGRIRIWLLSWVPPCAACASPYVARCNLDWRGAAAQWANRFGWPILS